MRWSSARYWRFSWVCSLIAPGGVCSRLRRPSPWSPAVSSAQRSGFGFWHHCRRISALDRRLGCHRIVGTGALRPQRTCRLESSSIGNRCGVGPDERCIRYSRTAGYSLCGGDPFRTREVPGLPHDVLLVFERGVTGHVRRGRADFSTTFSIVMGCSSSNVAGQSGW